MPYPKYASLLLFALNLALCMQAKRPDPEHQHMLDAICAYQGPRTFLLSFPRSGNTWLRYCLEFLTQRPSFSHTGLYYEIQRPLGWTAGFALDVDKAPIQKIHTQYEIIGNDAQIHPANPDIDILILLLRNPKETFARHKYNSWQSMLRDHTVGKGYAVQTYFENLVLFESWPKDKRLLIYYEDFITKPRETLETILAFLHESSMPLDEFMRDYEHHRNACLTLYNGAVSKGEDILFHAKKTSAKFRKLVDTWISDAYPTLWETYLKDRYAETLDCCSQI